MRLRANARAEKFPGGILGFLLSVRKQDYLGRVLEGDEFFVAGSELIANQRCHTEWQAAILF